MRDPKRIPVILDLIKTYWEKNPQLRLGQLLINFDVTTCDLYHLEDEELEVMLKAAIKELTDVNK